MKLKLLIEGGDMKPGPATGQQLGPLGINIGQVISKVNEATKDFKGMKVPVELDINTKTKNFTVNVSSPPTSELLKKELGIEKGSGTPNITRVGNLAIEQIIKVAKTKYSNMIVSDFKAAVKTVVGSCVSLGIFIDNKEPKEVEKEINSGHYDKEISEQKTEVDDKKKEKLVKFFEKIKETQEKLAAQKAAEEAAKEAEKEKAVTEGEEKPTEVEEQEKSKAEEKTETPKK